jgi:ABC-type glycerol-3-phosphate transport system substrate-binding protein
LILLTGVVLTGCSSGAGSSASNQATHLGVLVQAGGPGDAVKQLATQYEQAYPGTTVEVTELPYDNTRERSLADFTSHKGAYDVVAMDYLWTKEYAKAGFIVPLDDFVAKAKDTIKLDDFFKSYIDYGTIDGKLYGLPWLGAVYMLYYRKDLLAASNTAVPTTWDGYAAAAKTLQEKTGLYGATFIGKRDDPLVDEFWSIAWSYGAQIYDGHAATIDTPEALAALKVWADVYKTASPDSLDADWPTVAASFSQGKSAMMLNFSDTSETILGKDSKVAETVGFAPLPKGPTGKLTPNLGGWAIGVNADSKNQQAAFDFIAWLTSAATQEAGLPLGGSVTRASVLSNPALAQKYPYFAAELVNFQNSVPFPQATNWVKWEAAMAPPISEGLGGQRSLESALQVAQERLQPLVQEEFP